MTSTNHNYCLILAGGIGSRLWPMSRKSCPKQFLDIFGTGRTLLQETYERYAQFLPADHIFISTHVDYLPYVYEQLPGVDDLHILEEPLHRGTLASAAWGTVFVKKVDPEANLIVSPADQFIQGTVDFQQDIRRAFEFVSQENRIVVMGIRPSRPETAYGYVQMGDVTSEEGIFHLKTFTEKPDQQFAEIFVSDGSFLWNTGIFLFNVDTMLDNIYKLVPEYQVEIPKMLAEAETADPKFLPDFFSVLPKLNIDMSVMEKSDNVYVFESHFGWADLGAWDTLDDGRKTDAQGNLLLATRALLSECSDNIVRLPNNHVAILHGLHGYAVVEEGDVLLVCPKKEAATLRRLMTEAQTNLNIE